MALPFYNWSRTAASNATADSTVNWAEGMAPSAVNDSGRAMMASLAGYRDDIAGAIVTGGTSTAYTVGSYQVFDTLAHMSGQLISFTPHTTNGATVTLNVDGLGAKPLRQSPSVELPAGVLIQGSPYVALYNNSDAAWYLQNFYVNPYSIPIAGGIDYWGTTAPNSAFAFPAGQAISRTTYSVLFGIMGTTYGVGDGSTTFNLPDKTGRVSAMKEASATRLTAAGSGITGSTMGSANGLTETHTLTLAQLPTGISSAGTFTGSDTGIVKGTTTTLFSSTSGANVFKAWNTADAISVLNNLQTTGTTLSNNTSGNAHNNVQPTIVTNYVIRII